MTTQRSLSLSNLQTSYLGQTIIIFIREEKGMIRCQRNVAEIVMESGKTKNSVNDELERVSCSLVVTTTEIKTQQ